MECGGEGRSKELISGHGQPALELKITESIYEEHQACPRYKETSQIHRLHLPIQTALFSFGMLLYNRACPSLLPPQGRCQFVCPKVKDLGKLLSRTLARPRGGRKGKSSKDGLWAPCIWGNPHMVGRVAGYDFALPTPQPKGGTLLSCP